MIAYVKGIIAHKDGYGVILEANGIGYEMSMSSKALGTLPAVGNTAQVWTYLHVKDDGMSLFGFCDASEKEMFVKLIGVSGIGPKMAISALSTFNPKELASAIAAGDVTRISSVPGIGKKTAQRLVLELKDKVTDEELTSSGPSVSVRPAADSAETEAIEALMALGYPASDAAKAVSAVAGQAAKTDEILRLALRGMTGGR